MSCESFVSDYEAALATQDWAVVAPLIADDARVVFSDGTLLAGKEAIRAAYERNFASIEGEEFRVSNIHWLLKSDQAAAYMFEFHWTGLIQGRVASGSGRGTTVLERRDGIWVLVGEQLGPKS